MPAPRPLAHSLVLGELLVAYDVDETASNNGDAMGLSLEDKLDGFICGEITGDGSEDESLVADPLL